MTTNQPKRILFTGYAPVHFLCFLPVYRELAKRPDVELFLSGGFRKKGEEMVFSLDHFYDPYSVDLSRVIPIETAKREDFDVLVCSHLSDVLFPRSAKQTIQIFHGVSFKNLAVRDKALLFQTLCLPGRYHAELYQRAGLIREDGSECLLTGFAKMQALLSLVEQRDSILRNLGLDPSAKTLLFAPTGEKDNALETMGIDVIQRIARDGAFNLLIKPHDHPKREIDWFETLAPFEGANVRVIRDRDVIPYLAAADLLLTDASSVAVEYTLLDRPIIFLDVPLLFERVSERAPNLDLESYGRKIGTIVKDAHDVVDAIRDSLAHPDREGAIRRAMAAHVFHEPDRAVRKVTDVVLHRAGLLDELPLDIPRLEPSVVAA